MQQQKVLTTLAALTLASVLVAGCGSNTAAPQSNPAPATNPAPTGPAPKLTFIVGGLEKIIYLPAMLTEKLGYFKDEGLDVTLVNESAGQDAEEALVAGEIQGVVGFYDHTIDLQSKGKFVTDIVIFGGNPGETLMLSTRLKDQVKTLADLKGKKIGVTGLGSSTNFLSAYLVTKGGNKISDYTPLAVGAGQTLIAAMEKGDIDLGMTTEPTVSLLKKKGDAVEFVVMRDNKGTADALGGAYPASSLYMQSDYVAKHPDVVQKVANAMVKTMRWIHTHTPEEIAAKLPVEYQAGDHDLYIAALTASMSMYSPDGKMPAGGPDQVLKVLSGFNKKIDPSKIDLSKTYTTQFVDKVP